MTKFAHTTPPVDAAARRKAPPVLTYSVEQLPLFDSAFYNGARAELSKVAELTVPPREARAFEVSAGHFFRIVSVGGSRRCRSFAELRSVIIKARALAFGEVERERAAAAVERWLLAALDEERTTRVAAGGDRFSFLSGLPAPGGLVLADIEQARSRRAA